MGKNVYLQVGQRIQALRKAHGYTQNELAERAELGVSYLVKLEGGVRKARLEVLERLARALNEPMWRLFADARLTPEEERWRGDGRKLAELTRDLSAENIRVLVGVAQQLAAGRRRS